MEVAVSMRTGAVEGIMLSESKRKKKKRKKKQKSPEMQRRSDMLKVMMPMLSDEHGIELAKALEKEDGEAAYAAIEKMGQTIRSRLSKKKKDWLGGQSEFSAALLFFDVKNFERFGIANRPFWWSPPKKIVPAWSQKNAIFHLFQKVNLKDFKSSAEDCTRIEDRAEPHFWVVQNGLVEIELNWQENQALIPIAHFLTIFWHHQMTGFQKRPRSLRQDRESLSCAVVSNFKKVGRKRP